MMTPVWARRIRAELDAVNACDTWIMVAHSMATLLARELPQTTDEISDGTKLVRVAGYTVSCPHPYCGELHGNSFDTLVWVCVEDDCACPLPVQAKIHRLYLAPAHFTPAQVETYKVLRADGMDPYDAGRAAELLT